MFYIFTVNIHVNKTKRRRLKNNAIELNTCPQESTNLSQLRAQVCSPHRRTADIKANECTATVRTKGLKCEKEKNPPHTFMPFWMHRLKSYLLLPEAHKKQWANARSCSWAQNRPKALHQFFFKHPYSSEDFHASSYSEHAGRHLDNHSTPNLATREGQIPHDCLTLSCIRETNLITIHMLPMRKRNKSKIWFWLQITHNSCI